jgi:hypothetical protein
MSRREKENTVAIFKSEMENRLSYRKKNLINSPQSIELVTIKKMAQKW